MTPELAQSILESLIDEAQERGEPTADARFALDFFTISEVVRKQ